MRIPWWLRILLNGGYPRHLECYRLYDIYLLNAEGNVAVSWEIEDQPIFTRPLSSVLEARQYIDDRYESLRTFLEDDDGSHSAH